MKRNSYAYADVDFTGMRFGRLTVISKSEKGRAWWNCKCDCGNNIELLSSRLIKYKSCGCLEKENKENLAKYSITHGMTNTRIYSIYCGMKDRCYNPNYEHYERYGGRGIRLCREWENSFESFYEWAINAGYDDSKSGKEQSIDRIDVNGNYEPSNCRWATIKEQARNKSCSVFVQSENGIISAREFAEKNNINNYVFVFRRAKKSQTAEQILHDWNMLYNTPKNFMTVKEASVVYNVCVESINVWIRQGKLQAEKVGTKYFVPKGQII